MAFYLYFWKKSNFCTSVTIAREIADVSRRARKSGNGVLEYCPADRLYWFINYQNNKDIWRHAAFRYFVTSAYLLGQIHITYNTY